MFQKTLFALFAALVLTASFGNVAGAQSRCASGPDDLISAYPAYMHCR